MCGGLWLPWMGSGWLSCVPCSQPARAGCILEKGEIFALVMLQGGMAQLLPKWCPIPPKHTELLHKLLLLESFCSSNYSKF